MAVIYPVAGGKGGIGKSFITANIGCLLAKTGKKVLLADLDLGGANLHNILGIKEAEFGLHNFLDKSKKELRQVIIDSPVPNLSLLNSKNCSIEIANLQHFQKQKIIKNIRHLPYDYILLDLGAGTNFNTLDFFLSSRNTILIFTPEPTSIEIGVLFIKAAYYRQLKQIIKQHSLNAILKETEEKFGPNAPNIIERVLRYDPEKEPLLREQLKKNRFHFIVNQTRKQSGFPVGETIKRLCDRHFYSEFQFLGNVAFDDRVYESMLSKQIFTRKFPHTPVAKDLKNIAQKLL